MDSDPTYDLFEDVIVKIKWGQLTRLEQHTQLRRVLAIGHKQCIDWLNKEHQRRKHGDNFAVVMARQMRDAGEVDDADPRLSATLDLRVQSEVARQARAEPSTQPVTIYAGASDELMFADRYAGMVQDFPRVNVKVIDGLNHMGLIYDAGAAATIAADVAAK